MEKDVSIQLILDVCSWYCNKSIMGFSVTWEEKFIEQDELIIWEFPPYPDYIRFGAKYVMLNSHILRRPVEIEHT